jgi:protein gp37
MQATSIEWASATYNPVTGCTRVSPGCGKPLPGSEGQPHGKCYAETFAERWRGVPGHAYEHGFDVQLRPERLEQPLSWRKPSRIFVCSMADLFHADVPAEYIEQVWDVFERAHWHEFLVLTKRAERMERVVRNLMRRFDDEYHGYSGGEPLGNVWCGTSVETPTYYGRIRHLQRTPAAVRFLSCEPLLAPLPNLPLEGIDWCIVGGESGPGARPMQEEWVRDIVRQCRAAGVRPFVKQFGAVWAREHDARGEDGRRDVKGHNMALWPADLRVREMPVRDGRPMEAA